MNNKAILLTHVALNAASVLSFTPIGWLFTFALNDYKVGQFVLCLFLSLVNFWFVKNVSGRLLVRMRWWLESECTFNGGLASDIGSKRWIVEVSDETTPDAYTEKVFWWSLYLQPGAWTVFVIYAVVLKFSFFWTLCASLSLGLGMLNLIGYGKCDRSKERRRAVGLSI